MNNPLRILKDPSPYRLLADTTDPAQGAIDAAKAYANIVKYINEAENASLSALDAALEALNLVRFWILNDLSHSCGDLLRSESHDHCAILLMKSYLLIVFKYWRKSESCT